MCWRPHGVSHVVGFGASGSIHLQGPVWISLFVFNKKTNRWVRILLLGVSHTPHLYSSTIHQTFVPLWFCSCHRSELLQLILTHFSSSQKPPSAWFTVDTLLLPSLLILLLWTGDVSCECVSQCPGRFQKDITVPSVSFPFVHKNPSTACWFGFRSGYLPWLLNS